jgi:hypothetical protein
MKLVIKNEPPDVDLSLPLPPPSPTDDPLLLLGPARRSLVASSESAPRSPDLSREDGVIVQSHVTDVCITSSQVSTSPIPNEDVTGFDFGACADDSADLSMAEMLPLFDLDELPSSNGGWTDSDSDSGTDFDQSGDYTGKFTMMKVPTKVDPPTSGTRDRINRWGRPVSPFPGAKRKVKGSLKKDGDNSLFDDSDDARDGSSGGVSMLVVDNRPDVSIPEPYDVRDDLLASLPGGVVSDNSDDDANDSSIEVGMVKITSDDPRAAARAAAILKQV